ncbi:hypothetical protein ABIB57_003938 [Devosia sp. UYZn731]|uniref:hypothetical protein n=1 Tax=Devosia sp. UYZn731 TaxID=3156345 RepID=UPI0033959AAA
MKKLVLFAGALLACIPTLAIADDQYDMEWTIVSETGQQGEMPFPAGDGTYSSCLQEKRNYVLPKKLPRGTIVSPDGNSYEWTITAVACKRRESR